MIRSFPARLFRAVTKANLPSRRRGKLDRYLNRCFGRPDFVTRVQVKSLFSGRLNEMDIPATLVQLETWQRGESLLVAMPDLKHEHIEFLTSGMTRGERCKRFGRLAL